MNTYMLNNDLNGIEIKFDSKPDSATLTTLKDNGFRWHKVKKVWYAKQTAERIELTKNIISGDPVKPIQPTIPAETINDTTDQKALKQRYMDIIKAEVWKDEKMIKYAEKNAAYIVPLDNDDLTEIERPEIKTDFCFGYGQNGISTDEDYKRAADMMKYADNDTKYFIDKNLESINTWINDLKDSNNVFIKRVHYIGQPENSKLKTIEYYSVYDYGKELKAGQEFISDTERQALITGYEVVKQQFIKRLNTYLKRYGLSKLHTWTYLVD